jgi:hypothetical protein
VAPEIIRNDILAGQQFRDESKSMKVLSVIAHSGFDQQAPQARLQLHHLPYQQASIAQRSPPLANLERVHVALGQEVAAQAIGDLSGVDAIIFLLGGGDRLQHHGMRYFHCCSVRFQVIVDPAGKDRRFHRRRPRLRKRFHPVIEVSACCRHFALLVNLSNRIFDAETDALLVDI